MTKAIQSLKTLETSHITENPQEPLSENNKSHTTYLLYLSTCGQYGELWMLKQVEYTVTAMLYITTSRAVH